MSYHFGFLIESMVSVLLLLTILYCVRLNKQLRLLKADEQSLRATISELVTATEIAERAIGGLKATMRDGEQSLGRQLGDAERLSDELAGQRAAAEDLLGRLTRITGAGRLVEDNVPDARAVAAAADGFRGTGAGAGRQPKQRTRSWTRGMMRWARDFRLIPLVLLAAVCLFALKVSGLVFDGGFTLGERLQGRNRTDLTITTAESVPDVTPIIVGAPLPTPKQSWAQEMFGYGDSGRDITGSVASKPAEPPAAKVESKPTEPPKDPGGTLVAPDPGRLAPAGERAILERLQDRRAEIDARAREIDMRENLLKAAEKRVEARVAELKALESRVTNAVEARDKAEADRFKNVVSMYENMKPKEAARIFDRLDMKVLAEVSGQINPRKMSEILAQMSPEAAERLTVEFANRADKAQAKSGMDGLPKIEGRPSGS